LFENFKGGRDSALSSKIESGFGDFLFRDHMGRGWSDLLIRFCRVIVLLLTNSY
jgi:hypothetical protein